MKKVFSVLMATVFVFSTAVTAFALDMRPSTLDFSPSVSGRSQRVSTSVKTRTGSVTVLGYSFPDEAREVFRLVNRERIRDGKETLEWDAELVEPAIQRALEQYISKSHTRPDGSRWRTVSMHANAENLAGGDTSAEDVMNGWMSSPSHRESILDEIFTSMAVACVETDQMVFWVQLFHAGKPGESPAPAAAPEAKPFELARLQSNVKNMAEEQKEKILYDTRITNINNQLIRLNRELANGKKPAGEAQIRASLKALDELIIKTDVSRLSVYPRKDAEEKTGREAVKETQIRLDRLRRNLDRAMKSYGVPPAAMAATGRTA